MDKMRDISLEQAKKEIVELFENKKSASFYFSDIAHLLKIDLKLCVQACKELKKEDLIRI